MNEFLFHSVCKVMYTRFVIYLLDELLSDLKISVMMMINDHEHSLVYILFKTM